MSVQQPVGVLGVPLGVPQMEPHPLFPGRHLWPNPVITWKRHIHQHLLALGYDNRAGIEYDFGNCSHAWFILGLDQWQGPADGSMPVPDQAYYEDYCQCLIARAAQIAPPPDFKRNNDKNRRRRMRLIVKAIETLSGHRRTHGSTIAPVPFDAARHADAFPAPRDLLLAPGVTWQQHMARTVAPPFRALPFHPAGEIVNARPGTLPINSRRLPYYSVATTHIIRRRRERELYQGTVPGAHTGVWVPTERERHWNRKKIRAAEWEHANRFTDFVVQDDAGRRHRVGVVPCHRHAQNSLWHALSYQVNGAGAGVDNSFLGLRGGRREKAWLYNYFVNALNDPAHPRHRAYTWLQQSSKTTMADPTHVDDMMRWGELSMLRALTVNIPHGGRPKWPTFPGIFQLISDFFQMEVIVFVGDKELTAPEVAADADQPRSSWQMPYPYYVFGKQAFGQSRAFNSRASGSGNGQLFFVTDEDWQHFDAVKFPLFSATNPADNFDTGATDTVARYGHMRFPFTAAGLTDIPAERSADATAAPHARPADNPRYRLANHHTLVVQARNDVNFLDARWRGRMPVLPSVAAMQAQWQDERAGAGGDAAPAAFEPWLVALGGFWRRNDARFTQQWATGLYRDDVARITYNSRDALWAQGAQVEVGERRQEPNETHVVAGQPHIQFRWKQMRGAPRRPRRIVRRGGELPPGYRHFNRAF